MARLEELVRRIEANETGIDRLAGELKGSAALWWHSAARSFMRRTKKSRKYWNRAKKRPETVPASSGVGRFSVK